MKTIPRIRESTSVADGDDLIDAAYGRLVDLMDLWPQAMIEGVEIGNKQRSFDWLTPFVSGLYIPASKRLYWEGRFDLAVDPLPNNGAVYYATDQGFAWVVVKRISGLPRHAYSMCHSAVAHYEVMVCQLVRNPHVKVLNKEADRNKMLFVVHSFFSIDRDGAIWSSINTETIRHIGETDDHHRNLLLGSGALNLLADKRFIWNVEAFETIKESRDAKVIFGIDEPWIKSLFYARSLPITQSGRKRPILHWVEAHQRRIKAGIDVDVTKHLRGIEEFEMGGLPFRITQPIKPVGNKKVA